MGNLIFSFILTFQSIESQNAIFSQNINSEMELLSNRKYQMNGMLGLFQPIQ